MDDDLRIGIWNAFRLTFFRKDDLIWQSEVLFGGARQNLLTQIWTGFFKRPLDELESALSPIDWVRQSFFRLEWYEVYDFIEFILSSSAEPTLLGLFAGACNRALEEEMSGYRVIQGRAAQIVSEVEIETIEGAMTSESDQVNEHLACALRLLSDRRKPDFRNSVKESISAVEASIRGITGKSKVTLGEGLKFVEQFRPLHPALKSALSKLYGFSSDSGGIRHALVDASDVTRDDAVLMLVLCSAFTNYLLRRQVG